MRYHRGDATSRGGPGIHDVIERAARAVRERPAAAAGAHRRGQAASTSRARGPSPRSAYGDYMDLVEEAEDELLALRDRYGATMAGRERSRYEREFTARRRAAAADALGPPPVRARDRSRRGVTLAHRPAARSVRSVARRAKPTPTPLPLLSPAGAALAGQPRAVAVRLLRQGVRPRHGGAAQPRVGRSADDAARVAPPLVIEHLFAYAGWPDAAQPTSCSSASSSPALRCGWRCAGRCPTTPVALGPEPGGQPLIGEVNAAAAAFGVQPGMRVGEAIARCPRLELATADPGRRGRRRRGARCAGWSRWARRSSRSSRARRCSQATASPGCTAARGGCWRRWPRCCPTGGRVGAGPAASPPAWPPARRAPGRPLLVERAGAAGVPLPAARRPAGPGAGGGGRDARARHPHRGRAGGAAAARRRRPLRAGRDRGLAAGARRGRGARLPAHAARAAARVDRVPRADRRRGDAAPGGGGAGRAAAGQPAARHAAGALADADRAAGRRRLVAAARWRCATRPPSRAGCAMRCCRSCPSCPARSSGSRSS